MKLKLCVLLSFLCLISNARSQTCIKCDSGSDPNCLSNASALTTGTACTAESIPCYTKVDTTSGAVTRGCLETGIECTATTCQQCNGKDCNKDQNICQTCSSDTDATCVQLGPSNQFMSVCETTSSGCFVGLKGEATERRCAVTLDTTNCNTASENCQVCSGANCNAAIYPATRLQCYQCSGIANNCENPTAVGSTLQATVCTNYTVNGNCYATGTTGTTIQRGCQSDSANTVCPSGTTNSNLCSVCNTNGCNSALPGTPTTLTCIQCRSDNDANCENNVSGYGAVTCAAASTTETAKCYQTWYNNLFIRGCLANAVTRIQLQCANQNGACKTCDTDKCNFASASGAVSHTLAGALLILAALLSLGH